MEVLKVSQLAKRLGKTQKTIWNYMDDGKLRYHQDFQRSSRYFYWKEVLEDLGIETPKAEKINVIYCRVSTQSQKQDLEYQKQALEQYCISKGISFITIEDIGSGINYNKKGLKQLIDLIVSNKVNSLIVLYEDRLLRFGNEIIFQLCEKFDVKIEIVNKTKEISKEEELVQNVLQIITVFASKIYGQRSHKTKNIIKQNKMLWSVDAV